MLVGEPTGRGRLASAMLSVARLGSEDYMNGDRMFELAQALAVAKSRQDVPAALKLLHNDMLLESPAFGTMARGLAENEKVLTGFFTSFPDYRVVLQGHASTDDTLICWGTARMTMTGDRFGVVSNGRRAELPVFIQFVFKDDLIAGERFFFDLSALCAQSGVSTDAVRRQLFGEPAVPMNAAE
jgi:predicted ester cyclase